jgi:outer membrane lipoprotein-sorting protein
LVKSSSLVEDYAHRILREDGPAYVLELLPKPDAAVVWGKILYWVRKSDIIPLKEEFYDERGTLVRTMTFSEVKPMGGRVMPTRWEIRPSDKPGNMTAIVVKSAVYDRPIDMEVFSQRNLQRP